MQAANQDRNGFLKAGSGWYYYLETPAAGGSCLVRGVDGGGGLGWLGACYGDIGVVPALHLSSINPISGNGTKENPFPGILFNAVPK